MSQPNWHFHIYFSKHSLDTTGQAYSQCHFGLNCNHHHSLYLCCEDISGCTAKTPHHVCQQIPYPCYATQRWNHFDQERRQIHSRLPLLLMKLPSLIIQSLMIISHFLYPQWSGFRLQWNCRPGSSPRKIIDLWWTPWSSCGSWRVSTLSRTHHAAACCHCELHASSLWFIFLHGQR